MKWIFLKKHLSLVVNACFIIFLLILPYYLFQGKLFLGGDDTRLFYIYPQEYIRNVSFFSWVNLSSVGWNFSYQSFMPFVALWSFLEILIKSKIILSYFSFSLPFILGFIFFQKLIAELIIQKTNSYKLQFFLGSIFYIFSPILIQNHFLNPLIPIWLIGLIPAMSYFFLKYFKTGRFYYVLLASLYSIFFSFGAHNIPWSAGFLLPVGLSLLVGSAFYKWTEKLLFVKRLLLFCLIIIFSQSFWLTGFLMTFINPSANSFTTKAVSKTVVSDFANSVIVTSSGTIIYPLLNLYHRQIAFDFNWNLKNIFLSFYDKTYLLNFIYLIVLFLGIFSIKRYANKQERKIFFVIFTSFIISLYLFTVNIGILLNLYITLGKIPGFALFRNPYDKFALGYVLIYSLLITYCLVFLKRKYNNTVVNKIITLVFLFALLINILPIKKIIVSPLWTTNNIYKNIQIPQEYLSFMSEITKTVSSTNNILSVPYGIAQYTVIKDTDSNNVYAGVSPVVIFSGVNDISGFLSFNYGVEAKNVDRGILSRQYDNLNNILYTHNINYVFLTKNVPEEVKKSFLYAPDVLKVEDADFLKNITGRKIFSSKNGNYELYSAKKTNTLLSSNNLFFKKINRVKYEIFIKNLKEKQELYFNDTYSEGWNLYMQALPSFVCEKPLVNRELKTTECASDSNLFDIGDLNYIWQHSIFSNSHSMYNSFSNKWMIDPNYIKKNVDHSMYKVNNDGSIDVQMILYYKPQEYFYIGIALTIAVVCGLIVQIVRKK